MTDAAEKKRKKGRCVFFALARFSGSTDRTHIFLGATKKERGKMVSILSGRGEGEKLLTLIYDERRERKRERERERERANSFELPRRKAHSVLCACKRKNWNEPSQLAAFSFFNASSFGIIKKRASSRHYAST